MSTEQSPTYLQDSINSAQKFTQDVAYPYIRSLSERLPGGDKAIAFVDDRVITPVTPYAVSFNENYITPFVGKLDKDVIAPAVDVIAKKTNGCPVGCVTEQLQNIKTTIFNIFSYVVTVYFGLLSQVFKQPTINNFLRQLYIAFFINVVLFEPLFNILSKAPPNALSALQVVFPAFDNTSITTSAKNIEKEENLPEILQVAVPAAATPAADNKIVNAAADNTEPVQATDKASEVQTSIKQKKSKH